MWLLAEALKPARIVLWETPFCHSVQRRRDLLGETEAVAQAGYDRCRELTTLCATQPFEACDAAVNDAFGGNHSSG